MRSPGHRTHPEHKVEEIHLDNPMKVMINGDLVAESRDVVKVDEDGSPPRYYFPRADVKMERLSRTDTTTKCPFKGTAHYFNLYTGGRTLEDSVWTYEDPFDEHRGLKDRLAFYDEQIPGLAITPA